MFSTNFVVKQNIILCCRKKLAFPENMITVEPPPAIYACSVSIYLVHCSIVLFCQHIPCADPFSGCNVNVADFSDDE